MDQNAQLDYYCSRQTYCCPGCLVRWRHRSRHWGICLVRDRNNGTVSNRNGSQCLETSREPDLHPSLPPRNRRFHGGLPVRFSFSPSLYCIKRKSSTIIEDILCQDNFQSTRNMHQDKINPLVKCGKNIVVLHCCPTAPASSLTIFLYRHCRMAYLYRNHLVHRTLP